MDNYNDFKTTLQKWLNWFYLEDPNSTFQQVAGIVYDLGVFNIINEARGGGERTQDGLPKLNLMIHNFIDRSYFELTVIKICRILEPNPKNEKKSVYSLHRLFSEMKESSSLLTREHIMAGSAGYKELEKIREAWKTNSVNKLSWRGSEKWQSHFDRLSGVACDERRLSDSIRPEYLGKVIEKLESIRDKFDVYRNKFIAHCATQESRSIKHPNKISIPYSEYYDSIIDVWKIYKFINLYLLKRSYTLPFAPEFKFIEKPLIVKENIGQLFDAWTRFENDLEGDFQVIW